MDTEFIISTPLNDNQMCDQTSASEWKHNKRTVLDGQGLAKMCSEAKRKMKLTDEPTDFNAILSLVSPYNGHLYFSTQRVSGAVSQKHTSSFRLLFFGYDSWVDLLILPSQNNIQTNSMLLACNEWTNVPVVHPDKVLLFSWSWEGVGKTQLKIRINSKVSDELKINKQRGLHTYYKATVTLFVAEC